MHERALPESFAAAQDPIDTKLPSRSIDQNP